MEKKYDDLFGLAGLVTETNAGHVVIGNVSIDFFLQSEPYPNANNKSRFIAFLNENNLDPDQISNKLAEDCYTISIPNEAKFGKGLRPNMAWLLADKADSRFQVVFAQNKGLTHFSDLFENVDKLNQERFNNKAQAFENFSNNIAKIIAQTKGLEPPVVKIQSVLDIK